MRRDNSVGVKNMDEIKVFNDALRHCDGILVGYQIEQRLKPAVTEEGKLRARLVEEIVDEIRKRIEKEIK